MTKTPAPDCSEFHSDADELRARRDFMVSRGYRFCDIMACNCNSWHQGHAENRLREIGDMLTDYGVSTNGIVLKDTIRNVLIEAGYTDE